MVVAEVWGLDLSNRFLVLEAVAWLPLLGTRRELVEKDAGPEEGAFFLSFEFGRPNMITFLINNTLI